jgi:uroporphyrinogen-III synthase
VAAGRALPKRPSPSPPSAARSTPWKARAARRSAPMPGAGRPGPDHDRRGPDPGRRPALPPRGRVTLSGADDADEARALGLKLGAEVRVEGGGPDPARNRAMSQGARRSGSPAPRPGALSHRRPRAAPWASRPLVDPLLDGRDLHADGRPDRRRGPGLHQRQRRRRLRPLTEARDLPVFAVGDRHGPGGARGASRTSRPTATSRPWRLIAAARLGGRCCIPGPWSRRATCFAAGRGGLSARRLAVYETIDRAPSPETLAGLDALDAVLLHSPRAARTLAAMAARSGPRLTCGRCACRRPWPRRCGARANFGWVRDVAPHPDETALLDLLTL